ncbi:hypothetical protein ANACOL_01042 [Anaerotruncus colihominis DSM 17241]|uniref:Uncharacterized protein n=1 Tax=Anaerotruncus colihominis DSM 17241 TaxID=445972 RepID=B0P8F3_9FIRM|nr:hypothetical protein ANACOL_01042 [Anaerotruncus colihominis DSM 17241]
METTSCVFDSFIIIQNRRNYNRELRKPCQFLNDFPYCLQSLFL